MSPTDAAQLLQATQRMRVAWTAVIVSLVGYAWTLFLAIWAFLLKAYMDAQGHDPPSPDSVNYILIAVGSSSVVFGLWRWHTRHVDNGIASLYPTLVFCEREMNVPREYGTVAYLEKFVSKKFALELPKDNEILVSGVGFLVDSKRIGNRGHAVIDLVALAVIFGQFMLGLYLSGGFTKSLWIASAFVGLGALLIAKGLFWSQRNPTRKDLVRAFNPIPK